MCSHHLLFALQKRIAHRHGWETHLLPGQWKWEGPKREATMRHGLKKESEQLIFCSVKFFDHRRPRSVLQTDKNFWLPSSIHQPLLWKGPKKRLDKLPKCEYERLLSYYKLNCGGNSVLDVTRRSSLKESGELQQEGKPLVAFFFVCLKHFVAKLHPGGYPWKSCGFDLHRTQAFSEVIPG